MVGRVATQHHPERLTGPERSRGRGGRRRGDGARANRERQLALLFRTHGGRRPGAGRPRLPGSGVPHRRRERFGRLTPVHVTLRLRDGLPTLRQKSAFRAIHAALVGGCEHRGFRVVHYSVQRNHVHLITEAPAADALSRGVRALCIRLARRLNQVFGERGRLFQDRYHAHVLRTPREARNALRYVLLNARRHAVVARGRQLRSWVDPYSSGPWFDGWRGWRGPLWERPGAGAVGGVAVRGAVTAGGQAAGAAAGRERAGPLGRDDPRFPPDARPETAAARSYLLTRGWRVRGLISTDEVPGGSA